jgi:hypothetical protein
MKKRLLPDSATFCLALATVGSDANKISRNVSHTSKTTELLYLQYMETEGSDVNKISRNVSGKTCFLLEYIFVLFKNCNCHSFHVTGYYRLCH